MGISTEPLATKTASSGGIAPGEIFTNAAYFSATEGFATGVTVVIYVEQVFLPSAE
ncbi:MAG: hypothetical protein GY792_09145 [Gammaproteobacteria bacterium]|nr:hypothetical protein [Gammaproteobacteria bacterium]